MFRTLSCLILIIATPNVLAADPTRPSYLKKEEVRPKTEQALSLNGVIHSKGKKLAIINHKTYRLGEKVGAYLVSDITSKVVVLKKGELTLTLRLNETTVKKQSEQK